MLNLDAIQKWSKNDLQQSYGLKDTMLYAVSLGFGQSPLDLEQLQFVYEKNLKALPTFAALLCHPGRWIADPAFGVDLRKTVHGEQRIFIHKSLPASGCLRGRARVIGVEDKGDKGAIIHTSRTIVDETKSPIVSILHSTFCRADGGCGSFGASPESVTVPAQAPDFEVNITTRPESAILYRLNNDMNPLHIDPNYAQKAGFEKPILHGLCTWGLALRALLESPLSYQVEDFRALEARFSKAVYPGETIRFAFWQRDDCLHFQAFVDSRGVKVLDNGLALTGKSHPLPTYYI